MPNKNLKAIKQTETGLNTEFINLNTGATISREQAIAQINKGNPTYDGYHVVRPKNGLEYVRSDPNGLSKDNIE